MVLLDQILFNLKALIFGCFLETLKVTSFKLCMIITSIELYHFKLCLMITSIELYIFIAVLVTLASCQSYRGLKKM